jgi:type I restriction enzyme, S subunit
MAGEWHEAPLGELVDDIVDRRGVTPLKLGSDFVAHGYRVISAKAIKGRRVDLSADDPRFVNEGTYRKWMKASLRADDVILTSEAPLGEPAYVPNDVEWCLGQRLFGIRTKKARLHGRFLFYVLQSDQVRHDLLSRATGTTAQGIRQTELRLVRIPLPDVDKQRAIAHILGTLDDKIELNRRMNETLEAMARTFFKSWFVDFDPVRARAEGRDPGLHKPLADLFPAHIVDSELGEVPEGWEVKSLDQIGRFLNGLALQKYPPVDGRHLPVIKIAQLRAGNTNNADCASADLNADYVVQDGDILFSWSGSLECRLWAGGPGALNQHLFKVTSEAHPRWLCYLGIHHHLANFRHIAAGKATTMGHIQRHHLTEAKLAVPSPELLRAMDTVIQPIIESSWRRAVQSHSLTVLRDALLPKLISGELRLKTVENAIEEVT